MPTEVTIIAIDAMVSEQREKPHHLNIKYAPGLGMYLAVNYLGTSSEGYINQLYPSWWQTRAFNGHEFDISGPGTEPTERVIALWNERDRDFAWFRLQCIEAVRALITKAMADDRQTSQRDCLQDMQRSITNDTMTISEVRFGDSDTYAVHFRYPDEFDYYLWPHLEFRGYEVIDAVITE